MLVLASALAWDMLSGQLSFCSALSFVGLVFSFAIDLIMVEGTPARVTL